MFVFCIFGGPNGTLAIRNSVYNSNQISNVEGGCESGVMYLRKRGIIVNL